MNILLNNKTNFNKSYLTVSILGKSFKFEVKYKSNSIVELNKEENKIILNLPKKYKNIEDNSIVNMAIEKMYDEIAETEIDNAMEKIRIILGFAPEDYSIERMKNSFCKNKGKKIIVNPDIVKYSKKIIEMTLIQAFCKAVYKENSKEYKIALVNGLEKYEAIKYEIIRSNKRTKKVEKVS